MADTAIVNEARLKQAISEVRTQFISESATIQDQCRDISTKVDDHENRLEELDRKIEKEKFDRELEGMKGEFRIIGYVWKLADLGRPGTAARRRFLSNLIRVVFINQQLIDPEQEATPIADLRPIGWFESNPLAIKFGDLMVAHGIKERLHKIGANPSSIKVRVMRPIIIDSMYNDLLRIRRSLLDADSNRTIYVEEKSFPPFLSLIEKKVALKQYISFFQVCN